MHAKSNWRIVLLLSVVSALTLTNAGCPPPEPNPEEVLAGTWTLTGAVDVDPALTQLLLNFNSEGDLVSVTYIFQNAQATQNLTNTTTLVSGNNVTISSTSAIFTLTFNGTLNSTLDVITGTATWSLTIGNTTITAPLGAATLTKGVIPPDGGNAAVGETIWNANCIVCHNGTIAPAAADLDDAQIANFRTIHPQLTNITDDQLEDIAAYLATL